MDKENFKNLTESLSLYHRITASKYNNDSHDEELLKKLYVDILPNNGILEKILEQKTTFLVGRKGTGKSTIISRAQYEIRKQKKDISIYINAKTIYKMCEIDEMKIGNENLNKVLSDDEKIKIKLIKKSIIAMCENLGEELKKEEYNLFEKINNVFRNKKLNQTINELYELSNKTVFTNIDKFITKQSDVISNDKFVTELKASLTDLSAGAQYTKENSESLNTTSTLARVFNISSIINKFLTILDICKRTTIYIFIDDYSELSRSQRKVFMDTIISPFYHIGVDKIHFKIACYPNKLDPINLDSGKFNIKPIDLYDVYGINNNITNTEKLAIEYIKRLLNNRFEQYCEHDIKYYFDTKDDSMDEFYRLLYNVSINIPRILGHILNHCFYQQIVYDKQITVSAIKDASKQYYYDHVKMELDKKIASNDLITDDKVSIYVQYDLIKRIIKEAQNNKYNLPKTSNTYFKYLHEAYTSHFTISEELEQYIDELEFDGFLHKISKIAGKSRKSNDLKNEARVVYALDYGICLDEKINYSKPIDADTKYFQQRAFYYDDVIMDTLRNNKRIVCNSCGSVSSIDELEVFKRFRMKCKDCEEGYCSIQYDINLLNTVDKSMKSAVLTQQELDIISAIYIISEQTRVTYISANTISGEIDYNSKLIGHRCRILEIDNYINRDITSKPYKYMITQKSKDLINSLKDSV